MRKKNLKSCCILSILLAISNLCYADTIKDKAVSEEEKDNSPYYFRNLGDELSRQNKNTEALESYKKAISLDAGIVDSHIGAGRMYARLKDYDNAIKEFEAAIKISPQGSVDAIRKIIMIYLFKNDVKVIDYLKMLDEISPQDEEEMLKYVIQARLFGLKEVNGGLEITMTSAIKIPEEIKPFAKRADEFISKEKYIEAINVYKESIALKDNAGAHWAIGVIYASKLNRLEEAVVHLKRAIELEPEEKLLRVYLIDSYGLMKNYLRVIEESKRLLEKDKLNKAALFFEGEAYFELQEWDKAIKSWDKLKKVDKIWFGVIEDEYKEAILEIKKRNKIFRFF